MEVEHVIEFSNSPHWCNKARAQDMEVSTSSLKVLGELDECELLSFISNHTPDVLAFWDEQLVEILMKISTQAETLTPKELIEGSKAIQHCLLHVAFNLGAAWAIDVGLKDYLEAGRDIHRLEGHK